MIQISEQAANKLKSLKNEEGKDPSYFLRVEVKKGGCSGLSYKMDFDNQTRPTDKTFEAHGEKIAVDGQSFLPYLTSNKTEDVPVFSQTLNEDAYSLTEGHFKYIYHRFQGIDELYDLNNDHEERKNLINEKPVQRGYMRTRLFGWQRTVRQAETRVARNKAK